MTKDNMASPQVTDEQIALAQFTEYFVKNYPGPDTIISKPEWHAPKIFAAAKRALLSAPPAAETPKSIKALIEHIADEWDGCKYDAAAIGELDIGECIREAGANFIAAAPQEAKPVAASISDDIELMLSVMTSAAPNAHWPNDMRHRINVGLHYLNQAREKCNAAAPQEQAPADAIDAARWREAMNQIGGDYSHYGAKQVFVLRHLAPVAGADIMKGSVSDHFKDAIDAVRQSQPQQVTK